jgi:signal transduction histidine kinase
MEQQKNVFNISRFIDDLVKPVFSKHKIEYEIADDLYLRGSNEGFQIIMENLIDNAIKYSSAESKVVVKALNLNENIIISVEDSGIGIIDEEKSMIFERFYRSESALKKNIFGYGLGLSLVKTIVLSMEGKIKVEDNIPTGTKVIISFPAVRVV